MDSILENKVALITGGAGGIGKEAVIKFASQGAKTVFVDINEDSGNGLAESLTDLGMNASFIKCDVSNSEQVIELLALIREKFGRLDVLYNNASVYLPDKDGRVTDIDEKNWDFIISVNLKSVYLFSKYSIPLMMENKSGSIINTSSSAGVIGIPGCDAYTATKGATITMTRSMAVEYGRFGIRVNCIAPAAIQTDMMSKSNLDCPEFDEHHFLSLRTPLRRYGKPEEIANIALFLASDQSSYINGAVITADGGITVCGDLSKLNRTVSEPGNRH